MNCKLLSAQKEPNLGLDSVKKQNARNFKVCDRRSLGRYLYSIMADDSRLGLFSRLLQKVYPCLIDDCEHLVSKTAMTIVVGENCRLRHYLARLHRKTLYYSKSIDMLYRSIHLLIYYLKHQQIPQFS